VVKLTILESSQWVEAALCERRNSLGQDNRICWVLASLGMMWLLQSGATGTPHLAFEILGPLVRLQV